MSIELDEKSVELIGKAVVIAMLTEPDRIVDKAIKDWPDEFKAKVGGAGELLSDGSGGVRALSAQERFDRYRAERAGAEHAIAKAKVEAEQKARRAAEEQVRHEREMKEILDRNKARYEADVARYKSDCVIAGQMGRSEPIAPNPDHYQLNEDAVYKERARQSVISGF